MSRSFEALVLVIAGVAIFVFGSFVLLRLFRGRRQGPSIRMQVFLSMSAVSGVFAALMGLIAVERLQVRSNALAEEVAQENAELLARLLSATTEPLSQIGKALSGYDLSGVRPEGLRVEIYDQRGSQVYAAGPPLSSLPTDTVARREALIGTPLHPLGKVVVLRPMIHFWQILRDVAARAAVLALLLLIGTALCSALIGRAIAKPIERLTQAASRIAHGQRQEVLPRPVGREVRTLTAAVESMRRELEGRHLAERLAADLSHQLKNPVAAIRASAEVLADGALEEPATARRFVERILEAGERLLTLVNNLLALTRIQARGVEPELVDVSEQAWLCVDGHAAQAERLKVSIELSPQAGAVVRGDPLWLRRALDNLVENALEFANTEEVGPIAIWVRVRTLDSKNKVVVEVANVGPGIAPEIRERLFERFVTTRRDTGGSGLGLAIVAAVAEQHGGQVEVIDPAPWDPPYAGSGPAPRRTVFRLTLPRASTTLHQIFP